MHKQPRRHDSAWIVVDDPPDNDRPQRFGGMNVSTLARMGRVLYRVPEAMTLLSMSRSAIYAQIRSNRLRSVKQGRSRLIPESAIAEYVALLEGESLKGAA